METLHSQIVSQALSKTLEDHPDLITTQEARGIISTFIQWESQNGGKKVQENVRSTARQFNITGDTDLQSAYQALCLNFFNIRKDPKKLDHTPDETEDNSAQEPEPNNEAEDIDYAAIARVNAARIREENNL